MHITEILWTPQAIKDLEVIRNLAVSSPSFSRRPARLRERASVACAGSLGGIRAI